MAPHAFDVERTGAHADLPEAPKISIPNERTTFDGKRASAHADLLQALAFSFIGSLALFFIGLLA